MASTLAAIESVAYEAIKPLGETGIVYSIIRGISKAFTGDAQEALTSVTDATIGVFTLALETEAFEYIVAYEMLSEASKESIKQFFSTDCSTGEVSQNPNVAESTDKRVTEGQRTTRSTKERLLQKEDIRVEQRNMCVLFHKSIKEVKRKTILSNFVKRLNEHHQKELCCGFTTRIGTEKSKEWQYKRIGIFPPEIKYANDPKDTISSIRIAHGYTLREQRQGKGYFEFWAHYAKLPREVYEIVGYRRDDHKSDNPEYRGPATKVFSCYPDKKAYDDTSLSCYYLYLTRDNRQKATHISKEESHKIGYMWGAAWAWDPSNSSAALVPFRPIPSIGVETTP